MQTSRQEAQSKTVAIRKRDHPQGQGHGVDGHPPNESLRWDETPLVTVRPTRLQLPIDMEITTNTLWHKFEYVQIALAG